MDPWQEISRRHYVCDDSTRRKNNRYNYIICTISSSNANYFFEICIQFERVICNLLLVFLGAFGDVDGDGKLDVIVNLVSVGVIRDEHANFVKMKFDTDIYKINLDDVIKNQMYVPINATLHPRMQHVDNENQIHTLNFLPSDEQLWGGYMGTYGDCAV